MICKSDIANLKTDIGDMIGQKIIVKGSLGRSKTFEKEGTIEKAYPNIFVVKYEENERNVTYSYTDVLTRTVEVVDKESPVITLTGDNEVLVCPGKEYEELGYKAEDNLDGDITNKVNIIKNHDLIVTIENKGNKTTKK